MARNRLVGHVVGTSVRGAAHVRADLPNQDALTWRPASGRGEDLVVAVSDGHGSGRSFRSGRGAELAVEIATRLIWDQMAGWAGLRVETACGELDSLGRDIVETWARAVERDVAERPFTDDELRAFGDRSRRELAGNELLAYGATLVVVAVAGGRIHLLQLGDGDIVFVALDGSARLVLPPDGWTGGNETASLCLPRAWRDIRVSVVGLTDVPRLVLVSTDGYANSFQDEEAFLQVGKDVLDIVTRDGLAAVDRELDRWLRETTEHGAGDDVTLAVLDLAPAEDEAPSDGKMSTAIPTPGGTPVTLPEVLSDEVPPVPISGSGRHRSRPSISGPPAPTGRRRAGSPARTSSRIPETRWLPAALLVVAVVAIVAVIAAVGRQAFDSSPASKAPPPSPVSPASARSTTPTTSGAAGNSRSSTTGYCPDQVRTQSGQTTLLSAAKATTSTQPRVGPASDSPRTPTTSCESSATSRDARPSHPSPLRTGRLAGPAPTTEER